MLKLYHGQSMGPEHRTLNSAINSTANVLTGLGMLFSQENITISFIKHFEIHCCRKLKTSTQDITPLRHPKCHDVDRPRIYSHQHCTTVQLHGCLAPAPNLVSFEELIPNLTPVVRKPLVFLAQKQGPAHTAAGQHTLAWRARFFCVPKPLPQRRHTKARSIECTDTRCQVKSVLSRNSLVQLGHCIFLQLKWMVFSWRSMLDLSVKLAGHWAHWKRLGGTVPSRPGRVRASRGSRRERAASCW